MSIRIYRFSVSRALTKLERRHEEIHPANVVSDQRGKLCCFCVPLSKTRSSVLRYEQARGNVSRLTPIWRAIAVKRVERLGTMLDIKIS